jgi:hypothetical protein
MLVPAVMAACSSGDDPAGGQASEQHIDPQGTDSPGGVLVTLPDGAAVEDSTYCIALGPGLAEACDVKVGTPITNVSVGQHVVNLVSGWMKSSGYADISSGQTTTMTTALLGLQTSGGTPTFGLANGPTNHLGVMFGNIFVPAQFMDGAGRIALFNNTYSLGWGLLDGVSIGVQAGENKLVNLTDPADRRISRLKSTKGDYPTACGSKNNWTIGWRQQGSVGDQNEAAWDGSDIDLGIAVWSEGAWYVVRADIWKNATPVPSGERGAGPLETTIGVVDIDDVLVNGAQRYPGTWAVFAADPKTGEKTSENLLYCTPPTKTSAPLPPGHYRVEVYYYTAEAGQKTDIHIVDI